MALSVNHLQLIKDQALDQERFVKAIFSGQQRGQSVPWVKVVVRPVMIKDQRHLQFSYFDAHKDITKNYTGAEAEQKLDELLAYAFKNFHVSTTRETIQVNISQKGKPLISRGRVTAGQKGPDLTHNRQKQRLVDVHNSGDFLRAIGMLTEDGRIRADMQQKFRQINEFLRLIDYGGAVRPDGDTPLQVVDFGCGNAYLTFATYHYLHNLLGISTRMVGVDVKADLLEKHAATARALGWEGLTFGATRIIDFEPSTAPDIVLALHACDTATDEALAQAIRWRSGRIFCAPCCHHQLQQQLHGRPAPAPFGPVFRHGILKERLGDILTDSFRALILRIMGYQTEVAQFISPEDTAKNLMIRAVKSTGPGDPKFVGEYQELKAFWGVTPYLEQLLPAEVGPFL